MNWQTSTLRYHRYGATWVRDDQIAAIEPTEDDPKKSCIHLVGGSCIVVEGDPDTIARAITNTQENRS